MASVSFHHGTRVFQSAETPVLVRLAQTAVIGLIGTAPDADAKKFPLNRPVQILRPQDAEGLGAEGTLADANRLQWTGGDEDTVLIEGVLFPEEFGGLASLEGVRGAAKAGLVLPLITLSGNVYGMHVVEVVSEDQSFHDRLGRPRKDVFRIGLKRYTGGGFSPISVVQTLFG